MVGSAAAMWSVYVLRARDGSLYTGIARDVQRRTAEHEASGRRGAKYLRGRGPLELAFHSEIGSRGLAQRVEHRLRRLPKQAKESVVRDQPARPALLELLAIEPG